MLDHVRHVRELLLEVAPVVLQPFEQVLPVRERATEVDPPVSAFVVVAVMHVHLLSS
jgi:hypothetical protein